MAEGKQVALWIGVGCGIALLIGIVSVVLCVGVCAGGVFMVTEMPVQASKAFLTDLRGNNIDAAYQKMSTSYQANNTLEAFREAVGQHSVLTQHSNASFFQRNVSHSGVPRAIIGGNLTAQSGQIPIQFHLLQENQQWRIDSVAIQGQLLGATPQQAPTPLQQAPNQATP